MRTEVIIPLTDVDPRYHQQCADLQRSGVDPRKLLRYAIAFAGHQLIGDSSAFFEMRGRLLHDIIASQPDVHHTESLRLLHRCLDHIQVIDQYVLPFIARITAYDPTVRLERCREDGSVQVSVNTPYV